MGKLITVRKFYLFLNIFIKLTLLIAIIQSIFLKNIIVLFVSSLVFLLTFIPAFFRKRYSIKIPTEIELITVLFIYATLFLGEVHGYYEKFIWWDIVLHFGSAIVFGFIGFTILYYMYSQHEITAKPINIAIFSFAFAIAIGAIWEIFEFSMDQIFLWNMQKSGLIDTMWDLIVDMIGAIIAAGIGFIYLKTKKTLIFNGVIKQFSIPENGKNKSKKKK